MLLTKLEQQLFASSLKAGTQLVFPYDRNLASQLSLSKSWWKWIWYYLRFGLNIFYSIILIRTGCPYTEADLGQILELLGIYTYILLVFGQLLLIPLWLTCRPRLEECLTFTAQLHEINRRIQAEGQRRRPGARRLEAKILQGIFLGAKASMWAFVEIGRASCRERV